MFGPKVILAQFCVPHTFKTNLGKFKHHYPEGDMLLFSEFFNELTFLCWVNYFMSNHCCLKADCFTVHLNLVTSGLFKLVEFYDLGLPSLPPLCCITACQGLAVRLYVPSGFWFMCTLKCQVKMRSHSDMFLIRRHKVFQAKWWLTSVVMKEISAHKTKLK